MNRVERAQEAKEQESYIHPGYTSASVSDKISAIVLARSRFIGWYLGFFLSFALVMLLLYATARLLLVGVGIWGINIPVGWGFAIVNLIWWVGISHAGTLIAALLLLTRQEWRHSVSRFAEVITLFALVSAVMFPFLHMGRPWQFYWLLPYPNTMDLGPQYISPLVWDFFAIVTYGAVAVLFWYAGLLPDLARLRDRARGRWAPRIYGVLAMGWRGSAAHWRRHRMALLMLALLTPFIVTVHSVVALAHATSIVPGWHSTLLPPNFVAGAVLSGFGMLLALTVPMRAIFKLEDLITARHLDNMAKIMLAMSLLVGYSYLMEAFTGWYSADEFMRSTYMHRYFGSSAYVHWSLVACNVLLPQLLWSRRLRTNQPALFALSLLVTIGVWLDRFLITVTPLERDYLPSSWHGYVPRAGDWNLFVGSIGLFFAFLFLYIRVLPLLSLSEMQEAASDNEKGGEA